MKFTKLILPFLLLGCLSSCYDDYTSDYEEPNMGFAIEKPLRTVISDRDMSIYIGVSIGGKRDVDLTDWAKFVIDESLVPEGKTLLPASHYQLGNTNTFTVRKSNLPVADVEVKFTEAFYKDSKSLTGDYVLPFRMTENSIGAIREGADKTIAAIKYVSTYSGTYYRLGNISEDGGEATSFGDAIDLINCSTTDFETVGAHKVKCPVWKGNGELVLTIEGGNVTADIEGATAISATASYVSKGEYEFVTFTGEKAPQFDVTYEYESDGKHYKVTEKLVLRQDPSNDLRVETW